MSAKIKTIDTDLRGYLYEISELSDGWAGVDSIAPSGMVVSNTVKFLMFFPKSLTGHLSQESFTPTPYGTIVVDWYNEEDCFSLEVGTKKVGWFLNLDAKFVECSEGVPFYDCNTYRDSINCANKLFNQQ